MGPRKTWVPVQATMKYVLVLSLEANVGQERPGVTLGRMAHSSSLSTQKAKARGCVVPGQPGLQSKFQNSQRDLQKRTKTLQSNTSKNVHKIYRRGNRNA